jgi:NADH pyrophosphatase NudC (nudix superfamily)
MVYPSAKIILKHPTDANKILLVRRDVRGKISYEPAGGKLEIDFLEKKAESLEECAVREAQEELGMTVKIERYLGSYYFFWTIDSSKCSSCVVFIGHIVQEDKHFIKNADSCELPIEPAWVTRDDIVTKKTPIDECHVGLETIILNCFGNNSIAS